MRIYTIISWNVYYIIKLGVIFFLFVILQIYEDISLEIILSKGFDFYLPFYQFSEVVRM
jgi:hypothetical protein